MEVIDKKYFYLSHTWDEQYFNSYWLLFWENHALNSINDY